MQIAEEVRLLPEGVQRVAPDQDRRGRFLQEGQSGREEEKGCEMKTVNIDGSGKTHVLEKADVE